ncbi:hypothetical protein SDC9_163664 [bioreactor metagenome]|uniref:Uncharacterized protein n=1 Tax=bioreactor metagenome TaxID=1076179 RepID=A0A645FPG9_9ZZZZ
MGQHLHHVGLFDLLLVGFAEIIRQCRGELFPRTVAVQLGKYPHHRLLQKVCVIIIPRQIVDYHLHNFFCSGAKQNAVLHLRHQLHSLLAQACKPGHSPLLLVLACKLRKACRKCFARG